jgi:hypothetical protein
MTSTAAAHGVDPYGLLGVTVHSTCQDVRRAYYALALHAHPDKGGSAAQMRVVQAAYEYVSRQVAGVNRTRSYEDAEADFAAFLGELREVPCFMDVHAEAFDLPKFNDLWAAARAQDTCGGAQNTCGAAEPGGYGGLMAASSTSSVEYAPVETCAAPPMDLALQLFEEPMPLVRPSRLVLDLAGRDLAAGSATTVDYSTDSLCDYRVAFAGRVLPDGIAHREPETLDQLLTTRAGHV